MSEEVMIHKFGGRTTCRSAGILADAKADMPFWKYGGLYICEREWQRV